MSSQTRDRAAGLVLLLTALAWVGAVLVTIPSVQGGFAGARAFPLFLGLVFVALSLMLLAQGYVGAASAPAADAAEPVTGEEVRTVALTILVTVAYGALMEPLGFLPSTALFVAAVMTVLLRIRRVPLILILSLALPVGCYILFGKLLGTYLPPGTWITIHF